MLYIYAKAPAMEKFSKILMCYFSYMLRLEENAEKLPLSLIPVVPEQFCLNASQVGHKEPFFLVIQVGHQGRVSS